MVRRRRIDKEAAQAWRDVVMRKTEGYCWLCPNPAEQGHHIITQRRLQDRARQLGIDPDWLLWDTRNGIPLCYDHHRRHHNRLEPFPAERLPESVHEFAADFGLTYFLERHYGVAA